MAKVFLDTNIILYANDARDPVKQQRAIEVVVEQLRGETGVVSTQVLQEYAVAAESRLGQDPDTILRQVSLLESLEVVTVTPPLIRRGLELHHRYRIGYWDACILAAAEHARCEMLLSEDLNAGQLYAGVTVRNPFV